jgi:thiol-disulfide isomerase/thioredoxin
MTNKKLLHIIITLSILLIATLKLNAQENSLPPFRIMLTNGSYFTSKDIRKGKPVILIYFAPDCEHCQKLLGSFFKKIKEFSNAEIILVTFKPLNELIAFEHQYEISKYHNIITGTEGTTFYLRNYYKLMNTPFTALYNKNGKLVISYRKETPVDDLAGRLKLLNKPNH